MTGHRRADDAALPVDPDLASVHSAAPPADARQASGQTGRRTRRTEPSVLAAIALGGALGAPARYGVAQLFHGPPDALPWATFWTNISGSFALGFILALVIERFPPTRYLRPFVATGFLGAYTTYSTFATETVLLVRDGHSTVALAYVVSSVVAGLGAVWVGIVASRVVPLPGRGGGQ